MFPSFFMLDWLLLISFLFCTLFVLLFLFLLYMLEILSEERDGGIEEDGRQKKKKDKEKSHTEVDIEVSWWIADLKTDQLNAFSSQLEDGIESTRSKIHLNSVCTISVVCNSAVNTSILFLVSLYYCCHYSSINHYAAALYSNNTLHLISFVITYTSRKIYN